MGRKQMKPGTWGKITRTEIGPGDWAARCWQRDEFGNRHRRYATGATGPKAEAALIELLTDDSPTMGAGITSETTINELADAWVARIKEEDVKEDSTITRYTEVINGLVRPTIGTLRLHEATTRRLDKAFSMWISEGRTSRARNAKHILRAMFKMAEQHDAIRSNPMIGVRTVPRVKKQIRAISVAGMYLLRSAVHSWEGRSRSGPKSLNPMSDIIDLLLATGARIGEVLAVRWCDIDLSLEHPTVTICGTLVSETGAPVWRKDTTKSPAGMRTLTLPRFAVDMLLRRRINAVAVHDNPNGAVFCTRNGT